MISKLQKPVRVFGQRSIDSSLRNPNLSANPSDDSKGNVGKQASNKGTRVSLSDFLDRKLQKSSVAPGKVQGKSTPFLSPLGLGISSDGGVGANSQVEDEIKSFSDKKIFERFKHTDEEKRDSSSSSGVHETENSVIDVMQDSRKRKNPFEGGPENHSVKKLVAVLGGDKKRRQKEIITDHSSCYRKIRPLYNHYANGGGSWDSDMAGVDHEEVGFKEVWEGMGSTSLGGMGDWH